MSAHQVPPALQEKFTLLRYFAQYMDENLTEGGETVAGGRAAATRPPSAARPGLATIPQIRRWIRTPKAIIMHLTNGTIQVYNPSTYFFYPIPVTVNPRCIVADPEYIYSVLI